MLNNSFYCHEHDDDYARIDPKNMKLFADFIHSTGAKIVLSSDWKNDFGSNLQPSIEYVDIMFNDGIVRNMKSRAVKLLEAFKEYDLKLYDKTPTAPRSSRYDWYWERLDEIKWYIEEHLKPEDTYVIFDDNDEGLSRDFEGHFIQTKYTEGLREKDIERAKKILEGDIMQENKYLYHIFDQWFRGGQIWLYSDLHLRDMEMYKLRAKLINKNNSTSIHDIALAGTIKSFERGLISEEEALDLLDEDQIKQINKFVGKNDTLIILGDVIEKDHIAEGLKYVSKLRGYKVLVAGNHEKGLTNYKRVKVDKEDNHLFDEVYEGPIMISEKVMLSHEPIDNQYLFNIHGHDHSNNFNNGHQINCCAEWINYTPISLLELYKTGAFKNVDDIHRQTIDKATERKKKRNAKE